LMVRPHSVHVDHDVFADAVRIERFPPAGSCREYKWGPSSPICVCNLLGQ
jgi:hypothetical protein